MKRIRSAMLFALSCVLAGPSVAQTQIGGGTCSSSTLSGIYAFSMTGRQVTPSGNFSNVLQANGSANFDGLSKVTLTMTTDTLSVAATPVTWSGTYSMQANCFGVVNITTGDSATLNLALYGSGANFLVTGNDATYSYSGSGNTQPSGCSASTFSGVYTFSGTGYGLSGASVNGVGNGAGLLQFDGQGKLTANFTLSASGKAPSGITLTGSYAVSSNCLGSATLSDSNGNTYGMSISVYSATAVNSTAFYATLVESSKLLISGSGHAIYGLPAENAAGHGFEERPPANVFAKRLSQAAEWGE